MIGLLGLLGLLAAIDTTNELPVVASASDTIRRASDAESLSAVLIRPFNYDPADPWEYSRRQGVLAPDALIASRIWNRPPGLRSSPTPTAKLVTKTIPVGATPLVPHPARSLPASIFPARAAHEERIGWSVRGIPITMHVYGSEARPLLIFAAIHGDEPNTAGVARRLVEYLDVHPKAYHGRGVVVIAVANPDGLAHQTRGNAHDVDVNRNFPARNWQSSDRGRYHGGASHSSEPETQALLKTIELLDPRGIISLHAIRRGRHGNNFDGPGEDLAKMLSAENSYRVLKTIGYPTPGSFGSWAGVDRAIPTVTLELPSDLDSEAAWRENQSALLKAITFGQE